MRAPLSGRGAVLGDFGVGMAAALNGHPRRARIDNLGLLRWPSHGATLDLDFVNNQGYAYGQGIGRIQDLFTISGGANATLIDATGTIVSASTPRFDFDPVTLAGNGLLVEDVRSNLLLNALLDGTSLSTQSVAVTAQVYTLSFYGTGTVTLSGVSTAGPAVGSAVYPTRTTLTFTPTAGSLTLTVSGSVQYAKLEASAFATSFTPTAGASVSRSTDIVRMTGAKFFSWFNADEGTLVGEFTPRGMGGTAFPTAVAMGDGVGNTNAIGFTINDAGNDGYAANIYSGSVFQGVSTVGTAVAGVTSKIAVGYRRNDSRAATNGVLGSLVSAIDMPVGISTLYIGSSNNGASVFNGHLRSLRYYPKRLPDDTLRRLSA